LSLSKDRDRKQLPRLDIRSICMIAKRQRHIKIEPEEQRLNLLPGNRLQIFCSGGLYAETKRLALLTLGSGPSLMSKSLEQVAPILLTPVVVQSGPTRRERLMLQFMAELKRVRRSKASWIFYCEGPSDLAILIAFAHRLKHPVLPYLEKAVAVFVGNSVNGICKRFAPLEEA